MAPNSLLLLNILLFLSIANYQVSALKCYACTVNIGDIDQRCITNPAAVQNGQPIVNCNSQYCTSRRVEYKDPPNKVQSMHRGCDDDPDHQNTIVEDEQLITYYRACRHDLCNGGTGKGGDGGVGFDPETGEANVLIVKGVNKAPGGGVHLGVVMAAAAVAVGGLVGYIKYRKNKSKNITSSKKQETSHPTKNKAQFNKHKRQ